MNQREAIFVTGATGFVGSHIAQDLARLGYQVYYGVRSKERFQAKSASIIQYGDLRDGRNWRVELPSCRCVIHCAAWVHKKCKSRAEQDECWNVNYEATLALFEAAVAKDVKLFIFMSTAGVYGHSSSEVLTETSLTNPRDYYSTSKLAAETEIIRRAKERSVRVIVVRPPMIYGPGAPGNYSILVRMLKRYNVVPEPSRSGCRSFLSISNMTSFIRTSVQKELSVHGIYNVADVQCITLSSMIDSILHFKKRNPIRIKLPPALLILVFTIAGKGEIVPKIFGDMRISSAKAMSTFDWKPGA